MSSRVARKPIEIPSGVQIQVEHDENIISIKGAKGELKHAIPEGVSIAIEGDILQVSTSNGAQGADALAGTTRALINNNIQGVSQGFSKKLQLVGVGYRVQASKGKDNRAVLNLTLGLSHPVVYSAPHGIEVVTASATDIEVSGIDKQRVGQAAADIRGICKGLRKPEPYKGKGIRYADEVIILKETKKK